MNKKTADYLALALDNMGDIDELNTLITKTREWIGVYKIGLEQFIRFGPPIVEAVSKHGSKIFLDLKLHDIPNTVAKSVACACDLGVDYLTIHTQGGSEMMQAAMTAKNNHPGIRKPKIIGVTVLTSIDELILNKELNVQRTPSDQVRHLARLAVASGIDGIVCSAADLTALSGVIPATFEIITPGIRPAGSATHDQKRIATPKSAIQDGATILVLGRAITAASDPAVAAKNIYDEIASAISA